MVKKNYIYIHKFSFLVKFIIQTQEYITTRGEIIQTNENNREKQKII